MKPPEAPPEPPEPPPPWWHVHRWKAVHVSVLLVSVFVLLAVVIGKIDEVEWRRHHIPESAYETFQYPCEVRFVERERRGRPCRRQRGA